MQSYCTLTQKTQHSKNTLACITGVYLAEREARDIEREARDTSVERETKNKRLL